MPEAGEAAVAAVEKNAGRDARPAGQGGVPLSEAAELLAGRVEFEAALRSLISAAPYGGAGTGERRRYNGCMARTVTLSRKLDEAGDPAAYRQASALVVLLGRQEPDLDAVHTVLGDLEYRCSKNWHTAAVMKGLRNFLLVLLVSLATVLWFGAASAHVSAGRPLLASVGLLLHHHANLLLCTGFGVVGAIVSMLTRMQEFASGERKSRDFLQHTGFCLPLVGAAFGFVTYALFASGLIGFPVGEGGGPTTPGAWQFYVVVGFLSGFSERFTRGLLDGTASVLGKGLGGKAEEARKPERPGKGETRPTA